VVARFSAWGMSQEAIEQEVWEDLLHRSKEPRRDRNLAT
jgi:hypothetical protein